MIKTLLCLFSLVVSSNAYSWGANGHRIVGEIAERHLTIRGQQFVRGLLGRERLSHAAVWADEIRSDAVKSQEISKRWSEGNRPMNISYWHFVTIPEGMTYSQSTKNPNGDILWAMKKMDSVLRNFNTIHFHKKEALRLLAHYVGDAHQPLHTGHGHDKGGNSCWIKFFPESEKNIIEPSPYADPNFTNLHSLWDTELVESMNLSFTEYSAKLDQPSAHLISENDVTVEAELNKLKPAVLEKVWQKKVRTWSQVDYATMVSESVRLRAATYPEPPNATDTISKYCFEERTQVVKAEEVPTVGWSLRDKYLRIVNLRLTQAGIRLAAMINRIAQQTFIDKKLASKK